MRFYRIDHPTIMSGLVVRYRRLVSYRDEPEISASRDGVAIGGSWNAIGSEEELETLKGLLDHAFKQHRVLERSRNALPFSDDPAYVVELRKSHFGAEDEILASR